MSGETTGPRLVISLWIITIVALFFYVLRVFLKWTFRKKIGWDDYLLGFSWINLLAYSILTHIAKGYGLGHHANTLNYSDLTNALKFLTIGEFFATIALAISKTSFAVTLLRFAARKWLTWFLWFIIATLNLVMWLNAIFVLASCQPTTKIWDTRKEGKCWSPDVLIAYSVFAGSYSCAMDFLLSAIPILLLWNLRIDKKEKFGVCVAMSLGVLAGIAAAIKTSYMELITRGADLTFTAATLLIWAGAETAITIVATSIPYIRLLLKSVRARSSRGYQHNSDLEDPSSVQEVAQYTIGSGPRIQFPRRAREKKGGSGRRDTIDSETIITTIESRNTSERGSRGSVAPGEDLEVVVESSGRVVSAKWAGR